VGRRRPLRFSNCPLRDEQWAGDMAIACFLAPTGLAHRRRRAVDPRYPHHTDTVRHANPIQRGEIGDLWRAIANLRSAIANLNLRFEFCGHRLAIDGLQLPISALDWQSPAVN
jgi:hypothetical protein